MLTQTNVNAFASYCSLRAVCLEIASLKLQSTARWFQNFYQQEFFVCFLLLSFSYLPFSLWCSRVFCIVIKFPFVFLRDGVSSHSC